MSICTGLYSALSPFITVLAQLWINKNCYSVSEIGKGVVTAFPLLQGDQIQLSFPALPEGILPLPPSTGVFDHQGKGQMHHESPLNRKPDQRAWTEGKEGSRALPTGAHQGSIAGEVQSCGITKGKEKPSAG